MFTSTRSRLVLFCGLTIALSAQNSAKRPLHHRDYDSWKAIQNPSLSNDGKFLAYALFPEEGDGQLVVRNLSTGKEIHENVGSLPPAPDAANFEAPPEAAGPAGRGLRLSFTHDNKFLISNAYPPKSETDQAKKDRKRPDEMPRAGMVIVDLTALSTSRVPDVTSYQVPENGDSFVAYLKGPKPGDAAAAAAPTGDDANDDVDDDVDNDQDQRRGGAPGPAAGAGRGARTQYGSTLDLRDLRTGASSERSFEDVSEYSISKDAKILVYTVASKKDEINGLYSVVPGTTAAPTALLAGKGKYTKLTWDLAQHHLALLDDHDDAGAKPAKFKVYVWDTKAAAPEPVLSAAMPGFHAGYGIAESGTMTFSRDGSRLFVNAAPLALLAAAERTPATPPTGVAPAAAPAATDDKVVADLWHYKDDYVQPMQKVRAAQERSRTYRGMLNLSDKKYLQLSDPSMNTLTWSDNGRSAIGADDRAYRHMVDYDGNYSDVYLVDTNTGARKLILQQNRGGGGRAGGGGLQWSPDGSRLLVFKDKDWFSLQASDGSMVNLTSKAGVPWVNEEHDTPDVAPSYGSAGWTKDSRNVLIYDHYDVWAVAADGSSTRKLTDGRAEHLQFRLARLDRADDSEDRGIDPAKPLLFRVENQDSRDSGVYSLASMERGTPQKMLMGAKNYGLVAKAKDADVILMTGTTFKDQPDLNVTDSSFKTLKKVTDANPQQSQILWGTGELIKYKNSDGVDLQAALYKPENFDPSKKYPMMIYIYERLTQNVNTFVRPAPGTSINIAYYVSNGYLVLTPDIVYTTGHPGQSALKCVLPAIQTVVDKGFVDRNAIGIQGHSWGGYQTAYLVTQTNLFKAAEAGAPVVNMISAYDGIRWGTGLPRQFQYEKTQSRIGGSIWEYPLRFVENSPIFMVDRITTPVLILENDGDDAVPWYQGLEFFLSLRRLGKEVYLFNYNGEAHGLRKRHTQKDYTVRMQQYFDHFLKGAPAPEWMVKGIPYTEREQEKEKANAVYTDTGAVKP